MLRVVRVLAPNPSVYTLEGTNTWVVGDGPTIVIDPGPDDPAHLEQVRDGAGEVGGRARHPRPRGSRRGRGGVRGARRRAGVRMAAEGRDPARPTAGGSRCRGAELVAVHAPGHSADHVVFFEPTAGALFTGDTVARPRHELHRSAGGRPRRSTSRRCIACSSCVPRTIYPGHGPVRRRRGGRCSAGTSTIAPSARSRCSPGSRPATGRWRDLVARIYVDYPPEVHALAARSVTAHLLKLEREGRVRKRGRGASQTLGCGQSRLRARAAAGRCAAEAGTAGRARSPCCRASRPAQPRRS